MNERFQQLLKQSTNPPWDGELGPAGEFNLEKCFESIVRECAITITDRCEMRNAEDVKRAEYHSKRIKQHFGIED